MVCGIRGVFWVFCCFILFGFVCLNIVCDLTFYLCLILLLILWAEFGLFRY